MTTTATTQPTGTAFLANFTRRILEISISQDEEVQRRTMITDETAQQIGDKSEAFIKLLESSDKPISKANVVDTMTAVISSFFKPGENSLMMIRDIAVAAALETAKGEDGERWRGIEKVLTEW